MDLLDSVIADVAFESHKIARPQASTPCYRPIPPTIVSAWLRVPKLWGRLLIGGQPKERGDVFLQHWAAVLDSAQELDNENSNPAGTNDHTALTCMLLRCDDSAYVMPC